MRPELKQQIDELVQNNRVFLFMKGTPAGPQCGFSAKVVEILSTLQADFASANVLESDELRQGIKEYTDWPTIPQLYVDGEFVGGADIIQDMYASGELAKVLGVEHKERASPLVEDAGPVEPPEVNLTPSAIEAIQAAGAEEQSEYLRMEINPLFEHGLFFDDKCDTDIVVERGGVKLILDPASARRAKDITIDFVENEERTGFKIDNPNKKRLEKEAAQKAAGESLASAPLPTEPPEVTITEAASAQFREAIAEETDEAAGEKKFVIKVGARRMGATKVEYELGVVDVNELGENDIKLESGGVAYYFDPFSVRNLEGATIDFLDGSEGGSTGFKFTNPKVDAGWADPTADRFQQLLDDEINPSIAAHGGYVELLDIQGDTAFVLMGGGCQGCGMASVTLSQGIEQRVREVLPQIQHLVDTTDHASGQNPYYKQGK